MYVRMSERMYACVYACMYVCMYAFISMLAVFRDYSSKILQADSPRHVQSMGSCQAWLLITSSWVMEHSLCTVAAAVLYSSSCGRQSYS